MLAMALKELRQLGRDRRTVAMMVILPVLLLVVFGYAARFDVESVDTIIAGPAAAAVLAYRTIPVPAGFTHGFGLVLALVFPAIALFAFLFSVVGYDLVEGSLCIARPLWSTRIPLAGMRRAWQEPAGCKGALRIFGNGGMYAFTGLYRSSALGRFRLFGTDLRRAVVLQLARRVVVVTPADPDAFLTFLGQLHPGARADR